MTKSLNLPVRQGVQSTDLVFAAWPLPHVLQTAEGKVFCSWYWPFSQVLQATVLETKNRPARQNLPIYYMSLEEKTKKKKTEKHGERQRAKKRQRIRRIKVSEMVR